MANLLDILNAERLQKSETDDDFADNLKEKVQQLYWQAKQKYLEKVNKREDTCIVLGDAKLDAKLETFRSIDSTSERLSNIADIYQDCLFKLANEQNSLGQVLKECSRADKTNAGKVMAVAAKSFNEASHQQIQLYMPLLRLYQEIETFHKRACEDTEVSVNQLEQKRSKYRASLLWMKDASEHLTDPDRYRQLEKFRKVQVQVKKHKLAFDEIQMDVVQKIDLLMASRCNLMNNALGAYQTTMLETFEKNCANFSATLEEIKKHDIHEYQFKTLEELNPISISRQLSLEDVNLINL